MTDNIQDWSWLANEDLSWFEVARKKNWTKKCLAADQYANQEPWRRVRDSDVRTYSILLWLQNKQWRAGFEQQTKQTSKLCTTIDRLKRALEEEVLHGVVYSLYCELWAAWSSGTAQEVRLPPFSWTLRSWFFSLLLVCGFVVHR
jgi:hypothetical protein